MEDLLVVLGGAVASVLIPLLVDGHRTRGLRAVDGYVPRPDRAIRPGTAFDVVRGSRRIEVTTERGRAGWRHRYDLPSEAPLRGLKLELRHGRLDEAEWGYPKGAPLAPWASAPADTALFSTTPDALSKLAQRPGFNEALHSLARSSDEGPLHFRWSLRLDETGLRFVHGTSSRTPRPRELEWTTQALLFLAPLLEPARAAAPQGASSSDADAGACPRCRRPLEHAVGQLHESVCATCQGRFLPEAAAERLVEQELGIDREMLGEILRHYAGPRHLECPGCRTKLSPVRLKGVSAELCTGCGGLWLDKGELELLSAGRYEEIVAG